MKKKIVPFMLIIALVMPLIPVELILANAQSNVYNVLVDVVSTAASEYTIRFDWTNPSVWSSVPDNKAEPPDNDATHDPTGYTLRYRNATSGDRTYQIATDMKVSGALPTNAEITQTLTTGSIYQYQVTPYHYHRYPAGNNPPTTGLAPEDNSIPQEEVLVMTNISVEAKGSGSTLTVTWDNPQIDSADVFTGYRIYYQEGGEKVPNNLNAFNSSVVINLQNQDIDIIRTKDEYRTGVQRLTYVINDASLVPGSVYAVWVEPLYLSNDVRNSVRDSNNSIQINGKPYRIAFKTKENSPFRTNEASIAIPLTVMEDGKDFLKLVWSALSSTIDTIDRIEVWQLSDASTALTDRKLGTIFNPSPNVNVWQIENPKVKTSFQLRIYIAGKTDPVVSEVATYDPELVNITPNKPGITAQSVADAAGKPTGEIIVSGGAFIRYPYNDSEHALKEDDGTYIDDNIVYDLYITDALEYLENPNLPKSFDMINYKSVIDRTDKKKISFSVKNYYTRDESGGFIEQPVVENKIYYIRVFAVKPVGERNYYSAADYATIYIPLHNEIGAPKVLAKPPLKIKTLGNIEDITESYIGIEWRTEWTEVYNKQKNSWESIAAIAYTDGELKFLYDKDAAHAQSPYELVDFANAEENVFALFGDAMVRIGFLDGSLTAEERLDEAKKHISARTVIFDGGVEYEVYVKEESAVNKENDYETYINEIVKSSSWIPLTKSSGSTVTGMQVDTSVPGHMSASIDRYLDDNDVVRSLEPNKTYQIFLRPHRSDALGMPSFIFGTTLPLLTPIVVKPTVPLLKEVDITDTALTIRWADATSSISYTLAYSDVPLDNPYNADNIIEMSTLDADGKRYVEAEVSYLQYTIERLFPEQAYYVWVIAYTTDPTTGQIIYSEWSNPLYVQTKPAVAPIPPKGLGPASRSSLDYYNKTNSLKLIPVADNYMIAEWFKDPFDTSISVQADSGTGYDVITDPDIKETCLVKFNDLLANNSYYVRAKTTLTITKSGSDPTIRTYAYTVQFANNPEFVDAVETVIVTSPVPAGNLTLVLESDWCDTLRLSTLSSTGDFDSDKNPALYPLPDKNYEILYDKSSTTLTYRFRRNFEDADKNDDQLVDQRFISEILKNNTYTYSIDLTAHENYTKPSKRVVEIPYSIMKAFGERKITFQVVADNMTFNFSPDFISNQETLNSAVYGQSSMVKISMTEHTRDLPPLLSAQRFAAAPQKLEIILTTPERIVSVKTTDSNIIVVAGADNNSSMLNQNTGAYIYTDTVGTWEKLNYTYDMAARKYSAATNRVGSYAVISDTVSVSSSNYNNNLAAVNVVSKMKITDSAVLGLDTPISAAQFNNIVAAVAGGKKEVAINTSLSPNDYMALTRTNIMLSSNPVMREQGVAALIKLYEVKTKSQIRQYPELGTGSYADISSADAAYQTAMLKAAHIGFFGSRNSANPKGALTLGDMLYMVDIIMQDSGVLY